MKHLLLTTIAAVVLVGCASTKQVTKQQAENVLHDFFKHLDFENYDRDTFKAIVTDDFHIFEKGITMSRKVFFDFVDSSHSESAISHDWILSNFRISTHAQSAHISYENVGTFVSLNADGHEETVKLYWLENAYLVKEKSLLKIKFLHSEEIKKEVSVRKHGGKTGKELKTEGK
jgi:hypothetical protein